MFLKIFTFKESCVVVLGISEDRNCWPRGKIQIKRRLGRKSHSLRASVLCACRFHRGKV